MLATTTILILPFMESIIALLLIALAHNRPDIGRFSSDKGGQKGDNSPKIFFHFSPALLWPHIFVQLLLLYIVVIVSQHGGQ